MQMEFLPTVSRWRDPQLQESEKIIKCHVSSLTGLKADMQYANKKCKKTNMDGTGGWRVKRVNRLEFIKIINFNPLSSNHHYNHF